MSGRIRGLAGGCGRVAAGIVGAAVLALVASGGARAFFSNHFYSPSGNIECALLRDSLDRPAIACTTFNNGRVAYVYRYSRAYLDFDDGSFGFRRGIGPTLAYNRTWRGAGFRCESLVTGMQCESLFSGHGFKIAREGIARF